jgi:hypothetical protein
MGKFKFEISYKFLFLFNIQKKQLNSNIKFPNFCSKLNLVSRCCPKICKISFRFLRNFVKKSKKFQKISLVMLVEKNKFVLLNYKKNHKINFVRNLLSFLKVRLKIWTAMWFSNGLLRDAM